MTTRDACPLCQGKLVDPQPVDVCGPCHADLHMSGALRVETTAEFAAVTDERINQLMANDGNSSDGEKSETNCTYCGKSNAEVKKVLTHGEHAICNECVALCADIMSIELGDDWK